MRWLRCLAIGMSLVTGALIVAGVIVIVRSPTTNDVAYFTGVVGVGAVSTVVGLVVAQRRPRNPVGPLLVWIGQLVVFLVTKEVYWRVLDREPQALPVVDDWVIAALRESGVWLLVALGFLLLYFPDGRLPGRRWRWVPIALVADAVAFQASAALDPTVYRPQSPEPVPVPFGTLPDGVLLVVGLATLLGLMVSTVVCAAALVVKYRRGDEVRRAQLKWLALAGLGLPATLIGCGAELLLVGRPGWFSLVASVVVVVGTPVATAIAMLRHDLYDVDRALAAAVTYGTATAMLLGIYTATSFAAGVVLGRESTSPRPERPPCARSPWLPCEPGCSAGWTGGCTPGGKLRCPRSRACWHGPTPARPARRSWSTCCGPRCGTLPCESGTWCPAPTAALTRLAHPWTGSRPCR